MSLNQKPVIFLAVITTVIDINPLTKITLHLGSENFRLPWGCLPDLVVPEVEGRTVDIWYLPDETTLYVFLLAIWID